MIVAPSVGALFVTSSSLEAGSGAGWMDASYLSFIPPDMGNPPSHKTGTVRHKLDQDLGYVFLHSPFAGKTLKIGAKHGTLRVIHPVL